jgi:hypothetical protein
LQVFCVHFSKFSAIKRKTGAKYRHVWVKTGTKTGVVDKNVSIWGGRKHKASAARI